MMDLLSDMARCAGLKQSVHAMRLNSQRQLVQVRVSVKSWKRLMHALEAGHRQRACSLYGSEAWPRV